MANELTSRENDLMNRIATAMQKTNKNAWFIGHVMGQLIKIDHENVNRICERFDFKKATVYAYAKAEEKAEDLELNMNEWTISKFAILNAVDNATIKDAIENGAITCESTMAELKEWVKSTKVIEDKSTSEGEGEGEGDGTSENVSRETMHRVVLDEMEFEVDTKVFEQLKKVLGV